MAPLRAETVVEYYNATLDQSSTSRYRYDDGRLSIGNGAGAPQPPDTIAFKAPYRGREAGAFPLTAEWRAKIDETVRKTLRQRLYGRR